MEIIDKVFLKFEFLIFILTVFFGFLAEGLTKATPIILKPKGTLKKIFHITIYIFSLVAVFSIIGWSLLFFSWRVPVISTIAISLMCSIGITPYVMSSFYKSVRKHKDLGDDKDIREIGFIFLLSPIFGLISIGLALYAWTRDDKYLETRLWEMLISMQEQIQYC